MSSVRNTKPASINQSIKLEKNLTINHFFPLVFSYFSPAHRLGAFVLFAQGHLRLTQKHFSVGFSTLVSDLCRGCTVYTHRVFKQQQRQQQKRHQQLIHFHIPEEKLSVCDDGEAHAVCVCPGPAAGAD